MQVGGRQNSNRLRLPVHRVLAGHTDTDTEVGAERRDAASIHECRIHECLERLRYSLRPPPERAERSDACIYIYIIYYNIYIYIYIILYIIYYILYIIYYIYYIYYRALMEPKRALKEP
jgi:hypothetical protein